jgi:hypothetical protein
MKNQLLRVGTIYIPVQDPQIGIQTSSEPR